MGSLGSVIHMDEAGCKWKRAFDARLLAECPTDFASFFNQGRYKIDLYSSYLQDDSIEAYKLHGDAHSQDAETRQRELRQMEPLCYQDLLRGYKSIVQDEGILNLNFSHLSSQTKRKLPRVEVITNFLIRREYYRNFDPRALSRIFQSLPRLESINLERWIHIKAADERRWHNRMLKSLLPMPHRLLPKGNDPGSSAWSCSTELIEAIVTLRISKGDFPKAVGHASREP